MDPKRTVPERRPGLGERKRSFSRADMQNYFGKTTDELRHAQVSAMLYPPYGYGKESTQFGIARPNHQPKQWKEDYLVYNSARENMVAHRAAYQETVTKVQEKEKKKSGFWSSLFGKKKKDEGVSEGYMGVNSSEGHKELIPHAERLEEAAYQHAKKRTEHWNNWPKASRTAEQDNLHYGYVKGAWKDHERFQEKVEKHRELAYPRRKP